MHSESRLAGIADDLVTWSPPSDDPYVFVIGGTIGTEDSSEEIEARLEAAVAGVRRGPPGEEELQAARDSLLRELVFDVETTEDAAHQLAFFEGLDSLDVLLNLPLLIAEVTADEIQRVAQAYLRPDQRTIGWYLAADSPEPIAAREEIIPSAPLVPSTADDIEFEKPGDPVVFWLGKGLPLIFQRLALSPTGFLRVVVPTTGRSFGSRGVPNAPAWRHTSLDFRFLPHELQSTLAAAHAALAESSPTESITASAAEDPESRLELEMNELLGVKPLPWSGGAAALVVVGDLRQEQVLSAAAAVFGDIVPEPADPGPIKLAQQLRVVDLGLERSQAQIGYVAIAPSLADPDFWAWRLLLYILSHGYEGRLGKEAISRRGLVYYIDGRYLTDGVNGRVSLQIGVDPAKLEAMQTLLGETLDGLLRHPPTQTELVEAKRHFLGRRTSAAQSNKEVSGRLVEEWVGWGRLPKEAELRVRLSRVDLEDLVRVSSDFVSGTTVVVRVGK